MKVITPEILAKITQEWASCCVNLLGEQNIEKYPELRWLLLFLMVI